MTNSQDSTLAVLMGIVQGLTEFLPISSDGHLATFAFLFDLELSLPLVVLLHAATLLATVLVFFRDLVGLASVSLQNLTRPQDLYATNEGKLLAAIIVACLPTAAIGLLLEARVQALASTPWIVGAGFLVSALAVTSTRGRTGERELPTLREALLIGTVQGIAVLPGVSRSALTIASAMALGLTGPAAFRFSFLLSMPAIFGAMLLELGEPGVLSGMGAGAWLGALSAFVTGLLALVMLRQLVRRGRFWLFAFYLVPLGASLLWFQSAR